MGVRISELTLPRYLRKEVPNDHGRAVCASVKISMRKENLISHVMLRVPADCE